MVEKDIVVKEKVKYSGLGNFKDAYKYGHDWLKNNGFGVTEDSYSEKISGNSKEIEVVWKAKKKLTDYFQAVIDIKWRILGMTDVEVEIDGKKKSMNKFADLSIEIKGTLEKDYGNQWDTGAFYRFFKDVYNKYVIPARVDEKGNSVTDTAQSFKDEMKAFFELTAKRF